MPAETQPLLEFIDAMKSQGASDEFVVVLLRQNGWSEKRIYQAFSAWYEARIGRAVPNGGGRIEAAKDAFLYLLAFITLGIWAIQLGARSSESGRCPKPVAPSGWECVLCSGRERKYGGGTTRLVKSPGGVPRGPCIGWSQGGSTLGKR